MFKIPQEISDIISSLDYTVDDVGMTDSNVYIFDDMVLKIQPKNDEIRNEINIINKVCDKLLVPQILSYIEDDHFSYYLMSRIKKKMVHDEELLKKPDLLIKILADGLRKLWSIDISDIPSSYSNINSRLEVARFNVINNLVDVNNVMPDTFGINGFKTPSDLLEYLENNIPDADLVFTHGDYCFENIFYENDKVYGFIDLGKAGVADRWQDLAICIRELDAVFSNEYVSDFDYSNYSSDMLLDELGILKDEKKLKFYLLLDELF